MNVFDIARRPPHWLRVAVAAMLLAFALNAITHIAHAHDEGSTPAAKHTALCAHCAFDAMAGAPQHTHEPARHAERGVAIDAPPCAALDRTPRTSAQPRAPPIS
ncbi:MAG: hypothetical protein RBS02_08840 [Steroidobacteraceae bacterium]|jgi:hypothetical protein|nr:hypothetical protein [Steroidobacteraceae bacterium]